MSYFGIYCTLVKRYNNGDKKGKKLCNIQNAQKSDPNFITLTKVMTRPPPDRPAGAALTGVLPGRFLAERLRQNTPPNGS